MSLSELLAAKEIRRALIVDDVCDAIPTAADIDPGNEAWTNFSDDLTPALRRRIEEAYPPAAETRFDELITTDGYAATLWSLRGELGEIVVPLFENYIEDQTADQHFVDLAKQRLEALGLQCETSGRDFHVAAQNADVVLIDLFFGKMQDPSALNQSKDRLRNAIQPRRAAPPLVVLMSRSSRLEDKRDEFRDDVGLIDSAFRIIRKSDLEETGRLEQQLERLAENVEDSHKLTRLFAAVEDGMAKATSRTLRLLRKLRLSDIGQIQQLLLSAEGEPTGSYLVDVFDRVLQHEIEREAGIIDAAIGLNEFSSIQHPPPYVAGSPDLQELVERLLSQNSERLRLPGAVGVAVTFGDVLTMPAGADLDRLKQTLLVDMTADKVLLVLTPVCDLQREGAPRILLLVGTRRPLGARDWSYGEDVRTATIRIGGELCWIKWQIKHIDTVSWQGLDAALGNGDIRVVARLRESHALEIQQRVLSGLGRVGLVANLPATFPVDVEAYVADLDGRPRRLDVDALADGAVCFVGRDTRGDEVLKLVLTEGGCDGVIAALEGIESGQIAERARTAFGHVTGSPDLRRMLTSGLDLRSAGSTSWFHIPSETGTTKNVPKMGLLAWNYAVPDTPLQNKDLSKAGIILLVKDLPAAQAPGLDEAMRSGLAGSIDGGAEDSGGTDSLESVLQTATGAE
ncbi:hypothetical protein AAC691_08585 [Nguyenibacter vanlangensis]|uniref:Response receiver domain-containing protein n=1 Tax=Nguyenibacter vanlangensis TaxID=1216886 RepID=A0ABZ3D9G8_9PROT